MGETNNIFKFLGKIKRKNPEWTGETGKWAGQHGISIRGYPEWMQKVIGKVSGRGVDDFVVGNTIFMPGGGELYDEWRKDIGKKSTWNKKYPGTDIPMPNPYSYEQTEEKIQNRIKYDIENELPHVQQFRERGLFGFMKKYLKDVKKHGKHGMYREDNTLESFHKDYDKKGEKKEYLDLLNYPSDDNSIEKKFINRTS